MLSGNRFTEPSLHVETKCQKEPVGTLYVSPTSRIALRAKCRVRLAWLIKHLLCRLGRVVITSRPTGRWTLDKQKRLHDHRGVIPSVYLYMLGREGTSQGIYGSYLCRSSIKQGTEKKGGKGEIVRRYTPLPFRNATLAPRPPPRGVK